MGKFFLVHLSIALIALFPCIIQNEATNILPLGKDIPWDLLVGTSWGNSNNMFACASVLNIFFTYFGQSFPTCPITSDTTKMAIQLLGLGYAAWATLINDHITDDNNIQKIFDLGESTHNNNFNVFVTEFFNQYLVAPTLIIT